MDSFITLDEFSLLFRPLTIDEEESFELKARIVSDTIRQEAINNNCGIDEMIENKQIYPGVIKEVTSTVLARWITQPSEFPTLDSSSDIMDPSMTFYQSSNMGITILRKELKKLGILRQSIFLLNGVEKE
ncbi:phage Gp19/Gp15/Gp42 family protein [Erysipelotrichaceae bacterium OttesenSCG-928-M19]|nr:phage Gp19/Gp15/Gp42 family protein [Erysipelotrichaceae bacterium OttesenSCG-928-M19]